MTNEEAANFYANRRITNHMLKIDLNCDMGEGMDTDEIIMPWHVLQHTAALMQAVKIPSKQQRLPQTYSCNRRSPGRLIKKL